MRISTTALLLIGCGTVLAPDLALAQPAASVQPDVTVRGDDRLVCRRMVRTATRMRVGRVCRRMSEWRTEGGGHATNDDANASIDGAADTLEMAGEKLGTQCTGGELTRQNGPPPLGPR